MHAGFHRFALSVFAVLPARLRRGVVRAMSPSFTVGAIAVIERADGSVLLVRQAYRSRWGVPGGLLERGESPADGVRREVVEEVGLVIELVGEPVVVVDPVPQRVDLVYRARPISDLDADAARPSSPEIDEVAWFAADALPELQFETAQALVALARSSRSPQAPPLGGE